LTFKAPPKSYFFSKFFCSAYFFLKVRGVLGNKCAGQHNLKTVHFREKLASGNFLAWLSGVCVFLQLSIYPRTAAVSFYVTMVGATPYKLFLRVPWVNKQLASSDFTFRKRYKVAGVKYGEKWSWKNILTPFSHPVIENRGSDGFLGAGLAKNKFCTDMLSPLSPKTTLNLC
jgi:hypothetical protein